MKNKQQIVAFLKATKPRELKDELAIESFLARQGIYVRFDELKKTEKNMHSISLEDFEEWFEKDLPEKGDVIVIENSIAIVQGLGVSTIFLGVSLAKEGSLLLSPTEISGSSFRKADKSEIVKLQRELNKKNLSWSKYYNKLIDCFRPENNIQIRISLLGERIAIGVFREINDKNEIVMYCVKENDKPVRYSLYDVVGKASDYQLEPINNQERKILADELEKAGKTWNGHFKRIESINRRVQKDEVYYYIDDFWKVVATPDNYKPKDKKRFLCGNYFSNRDEAVIFLNLMNEERNRLLADSSIVTIKQKATKR